MVLVPPHGVWAVMDLDILKLHMVDMPRYLTKLQDMKDLSHTIVQTARGLLRASLAHHKLSPFMDAPTHPLVTTSHLQR